jgi:hypothetical protein
MNLCFFQACEKSSQPTQFVCQRIEVITETAIRRLGTILLFLFQFRWREPSWQRQFVKFRYVETLHKQRKSHGTQAWIICMK